MTGPIKIDTDLTMTGTDTGDEHVHVVFSGLARTPAITVTGTATSTYDGTTLRGIPKAPRPCPDALPRAPHMHVDARLDEHGAFRALIVHVTATVDDAGPDESGLDTRPVTGATVVVGNDTAHTDAGGQAILPVPAATAGIVSVRTEAGDTLRPCQIQVDLSTAKPHSDP